MRPYETITVRGIPIKRLKSVTHLASGKELAFTTRCAIIDKLLNADPMGEVTIEVSADCVDLATVIALEITQA
jgi:alpha-L-fucosidase